MLAIIFLVRENNLFIKEISLLKASYEKGSLHKREQKRKEKKEHKKDT